MKYKGAVQEGEMRAAGLKGFIKELIKQGGVKSEKYKVQNELMLHGRSVQLPSKESCGCFCPSPEGVCRLTDCDACEWCSAKTLLVCVSAEHSGNRFVP